jgi:hypothetical protein
VALVGASVAAVINREALMVLIKPPAVSVAVAPVQVPAIPSTEPSVVVKVSPVPAPAPVPAPVAAAEQRLYQFTDDQGVVHITDDLSSVPQKFRAKVTSP